MFRYQAHLLSAIGKAFTIEFFNMSNINYTPTIKPAPRAAVKDEAKSSVLETNWMV
jgi:hypothetical protein